MKVGIIGGGAVGLLIGCHLSKKHTICIYVRSTAQRNKINTKGLFMDGIQYKKNIQAVLISELKQEDVYIVCVKQTHIKEILVEINDVVFTEPVLFLQNGMGHLEQVENVRYPVYAGIVEHGVIKKAENGINHVGKGLIKV
ncbi:MAG TPA: 2-dehydropantoate 2-reductase N-terminal domain-containing protein, partial [Bacillota bacterium]|nr:2-dehydropantoate 2-reductase N-terminal domain-containing protein [Bacillota bacterium]